MRKLGYLALLGLAGVGLVWLAASAQERPKRRIGHQLMGDGVTDNAVGISGKGMDVHAIQNGVAKVPWGVGGQIGLYAKGLPEGGGRTVLPVQVVLIQADERFLLEAEVDSIRIQDLQQVTFEVPAMMFGEFEVKVGVRGWLSGGKRIRIERY